MSSSLEGRKVAILATNGFEQAELLEPRKALEEAGAETEVISPEKGKIKAWNMKDWGQEVNVDQTLDDASADDFSALLLPGGVMNPDKLRTNPKAVQFVSEFARAGKPIAAICHGPWLLVEADLVRDRTLTSWPSIRTDIRNAGGLWVDREVAEDQNIVTSRKPDDIPAFNKAMIRLFAGAQAQTGLKKSQAEKKMTGRPS